MKNKKENAECKNTCKCDEHGECNCSKNKLKNLEEKCNCEKKELNDKFLRLQAEYINYQNRTRTEVGEMLKYEGESIIKQILPIVDNFERAIILDDNDLNDDVSKFLSGIKLIYGNLMSILESLEVKPIDCEGKEFDPKYMEAILVEHDENKPENVVLEVLTKGYYYKDKVIRVAMVKVNK